MRYEQTFSTTSLQKKEKTKPIAVVHRCTSSIGVTLFVDHQECHETLLKEADVAMYQAKNNGRNQISFLNNGVKMFENQSLGYFRFISDECGS